MLASFRLALKQAIPAQNSADKAECSCDFSTHSDAVSLDDLLCYTAHEIKVIISNAWMRASRPAPALAARVKVESSDAWVGGRCHSGLVEAAIAPESLARLDREQRSGHDDSRYICDGFILRGSLADVRINVMQWTADSGQGTSHASRMADDDAIPGGSHSPT